MNRYAQLSITLCLFTSLINTSQFNVDHPLIRQHLNHWSTSPIEGSIQARSINSDGTARVIIVTPDSIHQILQAHQQHQEGSVIAQQTQAQDNNHRNARNDFVIKTEESLMRRLGSIPAEELNIHDRSGQTVAHKLTAVHWIPELIDAAIAQGVDITAQTIAPDKYAGSTLAHNVAGLLYLRSRKQQINPIYTFNSFRCLYRLWMVDNGVHFGTISETPGSECTVWDLLHKSGHLNQFLDGLPNQDNTPV